MPNRSIKFFYEKIFKRVIVIHFGKLALLRAQIASKLQWGHIYWLFLAQDLFIVFVNSLLGGVLFQEEVYHFAV